jgi:hypothetical protein
MSTALGWAVLGVVIAGFIGVVAMVRSDIGRLDTKIDDVATRLDTKIDTKVDSLARGGF